MRAYDPADGSVSELSADDVAAPAGSVDRTGNRHVWTTSEALLPNDTNGEPDVYVEDVESGTVARLSVDSEGNEVVGVAGAATISADGRFVAMEYDGPLSPESSESGTDIFVVYVGDMFGSQG